MNPSIQRLAQVMQAREKCGEPPYVLLLGSSLSLTPAVRRAFAKKEDWEAFWKEMQRRAPLERKALLKEPLDALGLELGYQAVAWLAKAGYFNLILTLNVDDALDNALKDLKTLPAREYRIWVHGEVTSREIVMALDRPTPRIKVMKLRGDMNAHKLPLTPKAQFEFPPDLEHMVTQWLSRDTIVVGDLPFDDDVQRCLRSGDEALWCILPDEPASDSFIMRAKQSRPSGEIITGADAEFNKFFMALAVALEKDVVHVTPAVEPAPSVVRQPRRIDAALPSQAQVGQSIDLVIAVKLPESPILNAGEIKDAGISRGFPDDAKVEPKPVEVEFSVDERTGQPDTATLEIQVIAPDFKVDGPDRKKLRIPPYRDPEPCPFKLIPQKAGELEVRVELYHQGHLIGTMCLGTVVCPRSEPIDRWLAEVQRVVSISLIFVIVPAGGKALAASRLPPAVLPNKHQIHLEDHTKGVVIGDAARVEQQFEVATPQDWPQSHHLTPAERRAYLEAELALYERNLAELRLQKARYGLDVPTALRNEIRETEAEIAHIELELRELNKVLEAEAQKRKLYDQGMACFQRGEWIQAIYLFQQILDIDKDNKDASQRLTQAKKQEHLEQLYAQAKQAEANQDWQRVVAACQEIISIAPFYRDVQRLLRKARFHSARQCAGAIWARYRTAISRLAALLLMVAAVTVLGKGIVSVWQPTPTPTKVSIEAFLITKRGSPIVTAEPGTTITATVQEIVQIQVEISATEEENLVFTWYTCSERAKPVVQKIGNPEMLYVAPNEPGSDCIRVAIEKGGVLLDKSEIFVDVQ